MWLVFVIHTFLFVSRYRCAILRWSWWSLNAIRIGHFASSLKSYIVGLGYVYWPLHNHAALVRWCTEFQQKVLPDP